MPVIFINQTKKVSHKLKLKVLWLKNFLGFGVNQISTNQEYLLTSYYFWPRTEAWEQLKSELDSKYWLKESDRIKILNLTSNIINYWGRCRNIKNMEGLKNEFFEADFIDLHNF